MTHYKYGVKQARTFLTAASILSCVCAAGQGGAAPVDSLQSAASNVCEENVKARVDVNAGHPWVAPFGLDRVGASPVVNVEVISEDAPRRTYHIVTYRDGKQLETRKLSFVVDPYNDWPRELRPRASSPFFSQSKLSKIPEEVALFARCGSDGSAEILARQPVNWPRLDAGAVAAPDQRRNPIDLGTILVPYDSLLLSRGQTAVVTVAAISHDRDLPNARLRISFNGAAAVETPMPLVTSRRATKLTRIPLLASSDASAVLQVSLIDGQTSLWTENIKTMIAAPAQAWPDFGAVETKLRYDEPISVKDARTGELTSLDYESAWQPQLNDVVVFLPNGSRFVFWRGSSYIPFWAGDYNTGVCYQWAENLSKPKDAVDQPEPLMDKELRYGRVRIIESTPARVHVRWTYQSADFQYRVWGDEASEDYFFYPDGFGTRVLSLMSTPGDFYQISEFIVLTPQSAFPLEVLPHHVADALFLDGTKEMITFPFAPQDSVSPELRFIVAGKVANPRQQPVAYRVFAHKNDPMAAIYFSARDTTTPVAFKPFYDQGQQVTSAYWGSHWPLSRGKMTGMTIDDRITSSPTHTSLLTWLDWPKPLLLTELPMLDALGRSRTMALQRWSWLIAKTDASDQAVLDWARSFSDPPSLDLVGARIDFPSYAPDRRALRLVVESSSVDIKVKPVTHTMNPVFELSQAPKDLKSVLLNGKALSHRSYKWDGSTLWIEATIGSGGADIALRFM